MWNEKFHFFRSIENQWRNILSIVDFLCQNKAYTAPKYEKQEAVESSAFPDKIKMKLVKLKIYKEMNILYLP